MVAGASGIDFALLVVAADDGVMPQTREHLAIFELMGVERGLVALTKADEATSELSLLGGARSARPFGSTLFADADIAACLRAHGLGNCRPPPSFEVESRRNRLSGRFDARFRMAIDRGLQLDRRRSLS